MNNNEVVYKGMAEKLAIKLAQAELNTAELETKLELVQQNVNTVAEEDA